MKTFKKTFISMCSKYNHLLLAPSALKECVYCNLLLLLHLLLCYYLLLLVTTCYYLLLLLQLTNLFNYCACVHACTRACVCVHACALVACVCVCVCVCVASVRGDVCVMARTARIPGSTGNAKYLLGPLFSITSRV